MGDSNYQTLELENKTDTPTFFSFQPDGKKYPLCDRVFKIFPEVGMIEGNSFKIITFEFCPQQPNKYESNILCTLNHSKESVLTVKLTAYCCAPQLAIQNEGKIFFSPSYCGVYSRQKIQIQSLAKIPTEYHVQIPKKYEDILYCYC